MAYELTAVVAKTDVLLLACADIKDAPITPLPQEFSMLPFTKEVLLHFGISDTDGNVPITVDLWLREHSLDGLLLYIESFSHGSSFGEHVSLYRDGECEYADDALQAVNEGLKAIGVESHGGKDAFETIGLNRHRHTRDWAV